MRSSFLARLAWRNLARRRVQTAVVLAGLLAGTAVVTASLTVADSLRYGRERAAFDAYGPTDELVGLDGGAYFPQAVSDALAADAGVKAATRATAPIVSDHASLRNAAAHRSVPSAGVVGFDVANDDAFGRFLTRDGRVIDESTLKVGEAYVTDAVAEALGANVGDTIQLGAQRTGPPTRSVTIEVNGTAAGAGACTDTAPVPVTVPTQVPVKPPTTCAYTPGAASPDTFAVSVERGAVDLSVVVEPLGIEESPTRPDMDVVATSPGGNTTDDSANGAPGAPSDPAILDVVPPAGSYLERGNWSIKIASKGGAGGWTGAITTTYAVFDPKLATGGFTPAALDPDLAFYVAAGGASPTFANVTVKEIVRSAEGKGAFLYHTGVFVPLAFAQTLYRQDGNVNAVKVSNTGAVETGWQDARAVQRETTRVLDALRAAHPDDPAYDHVALQSVKAQALAQAAREGEFYRQFLAAISTLTVVAGALLVVNVFVLLAAERKREIATARAVGLTRGQVARAFVLEGAMLAGAAGVGGVIVGLGGSLGVMLGFNYILSAVGRSGGIAFHPTLGSLAIAFAVGALVTLVTAAFASWSVSSGTITSAQRGLDEDATGSRLRRRALLPLGVVLAVGGAAAAALAQPGDGAAARVLSLVPGAMIAVGLVLVALFSPGAERLAERIARLARPMRDVADLATRYPMRRRGRTGLTVAMFSIVTMVLVFFSIFGTTFALDVDGERGGYDAYATTASAAPDLYVAYFAQPDAPRGIDPLASVASYEPLLLATATTGDVVTIDAAKPHYKGAPEDRVFAFSPRFAKNEQFAFAEIDARYHDGHEAFRAVLSDPTLAIVSTGYTLDETGNPGAHHVGSTLAIKTANGEKRMRVVGVLKEVTLGGVFVNPIVLRTGFAQLQGAYLLNARAGHAPQDVANELNFRFASIGMDAVDLRAQAAIALEENEQFLRMFQMFLGFGLVVGIASLAVVTARNVLERRAHVGILRAIGFTRSAVVRWFLLEAGFVTVLGTLVGTLAGTILAFGLWSTTVRPKMDVPFAWSYVVIPVILLLTYASALAATFVPAWQASREMPAAAVRAIE